MASTRVYASSAADGGEFYTWTSPSNANGAPDGSVAEVVLPSIGPLGVLNFTITRAGVAAPGKVITGIGYGVRWGADSFAGGVIAGGIFHGTGDIIAEQDVPSPVGDTTGGGVGSFFDRSASAWTNTNLSASLFGYLFDGVSNDLEVDAIWIDYYYTSGNRKRKMVRRSPHRS